jgi:hypothetical protein
MKILRKSTLTVVGISLFSIASPAFAGCVPEGLKARVSELVVHADAYFAEFQLGLDNQTANDLGGAIIEYTLTAKGRPSPLAEDVSQFAHTLEGGLLAGESTSMRDVISISEHAAGIIGAQGDAIELQLDVSISSVADTSLRPIGGGFDPFQLWLTEVSPQPCK